MLFRDLTDVSGRMAHMIQLYIITLFLCRLISDDCYEDNRCILLWWICSTIRDYMLLIKYLCVTWCGSVPLDCSSVLLWIDTVVFYFCFDCLEDY